MDGMRFDFVTRAIGNAASRRGVARVALGGVLALLGAEALAAEVGIAARRGDGARCDNDDDCGRGLFCKKIKNKGKKGNKTRRECRYEDGCGQRDDFCDESDDCCSNLKCDRDKKRCVR